MIIVLLGVDGSGKTELFTRLQKKYSKGMYIKESYPGDNVITRYVRNEVFETFIRFKREVTVIYDRATIVDDLVYEPIIGRGRSHFADNVTSIGAMLKQCKVIYLTCETSTLKKRIEKRGDKYITPEQVEQLKSNYKQVFAQMGIRPFTIDTTLLDPEQTVEYAIKYIEGEKI